MKAKKQSPARSLFKSEPGRQIDLKDPAAVARWIDRNTPQGMVAAALEQIERAANESATDATCPDGASHAARVRERVQMLQLERQSGNVDAAVFAAMKLTEAWMNMRCDALFASAVREKERRTQRASPLSTDELRAILTEVGTITAAAAEAGITERQYRNRLTRSERQTLKKKKRKS